MPLRPICKAFLPIAELMYYRVLLLSLSLLSLLLTSSCRLSLLLLLLSLNGREAYFLPLIVFGGDDEQYKVLSLSLLMLLLW